MKEGNKKGQKPIKLKTVGELKEFIKDLPDDMLLVIYNEDMETSGYRNSLIAEVSIMKKKTKKAWDSFDGGSYSYEVFEESKEGTPCLSLY